VYDTYLYTKDIIEYIKKKYIGSKIYATVLGRLYRQDTVKDQL